MNFSLLLWSICRVFFHIFLIIPHILLPFSEYFHVFTCLQSEKHSNKVQIRFHTWDNDLTFQKITKTTVKGEWLGLNRVRIKLILTQMTSSNCMCNSCVIHIQLEKNCNSENPNYNSCVNMCNWENFIYNSCVKHL